MPAGVHIPSKLQWTMNQDVFAWEMKYIHDNGYHVVPMDDVIKFVKHQISLPPGSVCITVDDGYKSPLIFAKPILDQYHYPWTFFIYPAFINPIPSHSEKGAASWPELVELQKEGVDIECHSMTHPILTKKGGKSPEQYAAWLQNETAGAKAILEQHMDKKITRFAYPYGEYNKQVEDAAIAAGFEAIFTVADNPVHSTTDIHSIGRYTITQAVEKNFAAYLHQSALGLAKADPEPGATINIPRPVITAVLSDLGSDAIDPASLETSVRDFAPCATTSTRRPTPCGSTCRATWSTPSCWSTSAPRTPRPARSWSPTGTSIMSPAPAPPPTPPSGRAPRRHRRPRRPPRPRPRLLPRRLHRPHPRRLPLRPRPRRRPPPCR
ncbi:MAG: polysaccharide deacetylase family protein [Verrucomicrobiota bacterium]